MPAPQPSAPGDSPRSTFERSLPAIDRIIGSAARRLALRSDEREDFRSWVHLRLIEDDYAVIRKFGRRSSLATFLTAVVQNLARDYRIRHWGRWRPSAAAEREGTAAVQLEIHLQRDGLSLDEAIESLRANHGVRMSRLELMDLAARLPERPRPRLSGGDEIETLPGPVRADREVERRERREILARTRRALLRSLAGLGVTDRLVLKMHYQSGLRISSIARALGLQQRQLYTRRDRAIRHLRRELEAAGLVAADVLAALGWQEADFDLPFDDVQATEAGESRSDPSNVTDPKAEDPA